MSRGFRAAANANVREGQDVAKQERTSLPDEKVPSARRQDAGNRTDTLRYVVIEIEQSYCGKMF